MIPPWAFWRETLLGFSSSLKRPRVLRYLRILPTVEEETVKPSFLRRTVRLCLRRSGNSSRSFWIPSTSSGVQQGFRIFVGLLDLPSGLCNLLQVTATGWGKAQLRTQKSSLLRESMDSHELSDGTPCGETQKVRTSKNMPEASLFPLCSSSCRCRAFLLLRFPTPESGYRSLPESQGLTLSPASFS